MSTARVTKDLAHNVAKSLLKKKQETLDSLKEELRLITIDIVIKSIPIEVMELSKKHRNYFISNNYCYFSGRGMGNGETRDLKISLPFPSRNIHLDNEVADDIVARDLVIKKLKKEIEDLHLKFETAIFKLVTFNRVEKEFPEAFEFFPKNGVNLPSVNMQEIRNLANEVK